eukprot:m.423451 g.423451  ORF g.423451 m.423451 type:complete len:80 (+) comp21334_c0_seq7:149-388(+)
MEFCRSQCGGMDTTCVLECCSTPQTIGPDIVFLLRDTSGYACASQDSTRMQSELGIAPPGRIDDAIRRACMHALETTGK